MKNILVVNDIADCGTSYGRPFRGFGRLTSDVRILDKAPESLLCAVFTGGSDVDPSMYGHKAFSCTYSNIKRDIQELAIFKKLRRYNIPLFGICRGAQFLCVMAGGKLVQHLDYHAGCSHDVLELKTGKIISMNSLHHQMQVPPPDAEVVAVASPERSTRYLYAGEEDWLPDYEYEVVRYPNINALGAQYHPESMYDKSDGWIYYQELIRSFLGDKIEN